MEMRVTADLGDFVSGQVLKDNATIAKYLRTIIKEVYNDDDVFVKKLDETSDDEIVKIAEKTDVSGFEDVDAEVARADAIEGVVRLKLATK